MQATNRSRYFAQADSIDGDLLLLHRYRAQEAQYMSVARALVLLNAGTLFGRTFYTVADSPWPNHMDDSGLVSSTMSPPLGATKHGRTLVLCVFGGQFRQIAGQRCSRARTPGLHVLMEGEEWRNELR